MAHDSDMPPLREATASQGAACAPRLVFLISEEAAVADDLGNLRRDHLVPAFIAVSNAFEHVS